MSVRMDVLEGGLRVRLSEDQWRGLAGADNPDEPNWVTVTRELSDAEGTVGGERGPGAAHSTTNYQETGAQIDASDSATMERWRDQNAQFFSDEPSTANRYQISPDQ